MLIVIEGLDSVGKSTQTHLLEKNLQSLNYKTRFLHFPRHNEPGFGEAIGMLLRGEFGDLDTINPYLAATLFAADQFTAKKALNNDKEIILLDRYFYSNIAYHTAKIADKAQKAAFKSWLKKIIRQFDLPQADIAFYLKMPTAYHEALLKEIRLGETRNYLKDNQLDIYEENFSFQRAVEAEYLELCAEYSELYIIEYQKTASTIYSIEEIHAQILEKIHGRLPLCPT